MIKVAVLDDYQNAFQQIVDVEKYKDKFDFKVFTEPFVDEKEAIVELENFEIEFIFILIFINYLFKSILIIIQYCNFNH